MKKVHVIDAALLLKNWQGHRNLTRRVIEAFPEKELFEFNIGGMRPFADMVKEMINVDVDGLKGIVNSTVEPYNHELPYHTKEALLAGWDEATPQIDTLLRQIPEERFPETFNLFGQYESPIIENIQYFIDNQIHHRGQGFVYLRALGIEPPFFWDRTVEGMKMDGNWA
ncbi:MAG: damage-inducible protein DinB [Bacteroidetes bacterium 43-16]|nr:MAG: damage-inducible protein DinB [Bacteroidetes bacterium 43-16]